MTGARKMRFLNKSGLGYAALTALLLLTAVFIPLSAASDDGGGETGKASTFSIVEAGEKGSFNMGPAVGDVVVERDESVNKGVLKFDYTIFSGSIIGVWTKSFPSDFRSGVVDAVKVGARISNPDQLRQISVKLEIKGKNAVQNIPMRLEKGWGYCLEPVDWNRIGGLNEVVFVVSPMEGGKRLDGIIYFDLNFFKLTSLQKYFTFVKVGLVLAMSLLLALIAVMSGRLFGFGKVKGVYKPTGGIMRDFLYAILGVLILGMGLRIYSLGTVSFLDAGLNFNFLALGVMGVVIAELAKYGLTGKHLTPAEVLQNALLTGLLVAASSRQAVLQSPSAWAQVFTFSNVIATLAFIIYHVANIRSLASSGKHLGGIPGGLIAGTPYILNWLLLVENMGILRELGNVMTLGILARWPVLSQSIGQVIVMFIFNEAVTNGIGLGTKGKLLTTGKAHLSILLVSIGVVVAPHIADLGSMKALAALPLAIRAIAGIVSTMLSFAGLWGEVYLITGTMLDGGKRLEPSAESISKHVDAGMRKGMAFSGIVMVFLYALCIMINSGALQKSWSSAPLLLGVLAGAIVFPLIKTIIETFDGSLRFSERTRYSYGHWSLCARGAIVGFGFAYMVTQGMFDKPMAERIKFGLLIGALASGGISFLRDAYYGFKGQGRIQTWKMYLVDSLLGGFIGSAAAFYLDSMQVPVIVEKFKQYTSTGFPAVDYTTYPLVNKWGRIDMGSYTGGSKLIYLESLAGVINWSIAAWLFAINKVFMQAYFEKDKTPIKFFFSKAGFAQLTEHMIYVLRWGLWMSPIIFTGLRMMPDPTWYNQDGGIRTLVAIFQNFALSPEAFRAWSLQVFVYVMAFDFFRVLIWMDHMGLRVATLVNLSFIGMDKLDEKVARFIGPATAQRYIPEGVKRFATWAPLLIPFYIPRGQEWDHVWNTSEAMQNAARAKGGGITTLLSIPLPKMFLYVTIAIIAGACVSFVLRLLSQRSRRKSITSHELANREYRVILRENGEVFSEVPRKECDVSRRSYDGMDPCGRILFIVEASEGKDRPRRYWPVAGNFPGGKFEASRIERCDDCVSVTNESNGVRTTIEIRLPDRDSTAEIWNIKIENLTDKPRELKVVPYLEWVLNGGIHDRFHTQYARLYPEMEYVSQANAILSWQKSTKAMGMLASDVIPEGFLTNRMDFIGRARSIWSPRVFDTMKFLPARDSSPYPTFDPIGSLAVNTPVGPKGSSSMRLMIGYSKDRKSALELIGKHLAPKGVKAPASPSDEKKSPLIGHGEIPQGTAEPYSEFIDNGNKLRVNTPYTPRPVDHALSNPVHSVMVTNRGLHTSCNGNSQQNRLTPDWADLVTKETPTEAIYLYDPDNNEWYSPTYHPLNDERARNISEFGVDGTAVFRMERGKISTELTVFVPHDDPTGVYLLTVKNAGDKPVKMRIAPYFQMVLGFMPERSGPLLVRRDKRSGALYFENPRNIFRSGWAFASMSVPAACVETSRGRFFGTGQSVAHPYMVEKGSPDRTQFTDERQAAAFLGTLDLPAKGERTVAIILGQADDRKEASRLVGKYNDVDTVKKSLEDTKRWWLGYMSTLKVETNNPEFDRYQNWLKYQALAERIWARRGFYQTSGAYGFRDQLQDTVNLIWADPTLARKQILLHATMQFIEGDVFHWFFTLVDGRTAFACRSQASDNPVWLAWGVAEYIRTTGDKTILDEMAPYMVAQFPYGPLPRNKQGWGHLYHRSTKSDTVYRHCLKSIDLVLEKRMGSNGLPLIGTGDWNDGLDEIGSEGKGESVWLGFFLHYILKGMVDIIGEKDGQARKEYYTKKMDALKAAIEKTWRSDRYLRAIHDDGTEIGVKGSGIWEIDALTAAWAVMSGINFERGLTIFNTALSVLEKENAILLGWPALREDTKPYLGRSSKYPEGVRENGMYCHGVQWLVRAARLLAEEFEKRGNDSKADEYRGIAYRLWLKISPIPHVKGREIEVYGGQPNKQSADILTNFDMGRMIWHGYTGAAGWMLRQAMEGVVGASLVKGEMVLPRDLDKPRGELKVKRVYRDVSKSPLK